MAFFLVVNAFSQYQEEKKPETSKFDAKRLRFGGDFWLSFGNTTYINLSPKVGYKLTERFTPGVGIIFQYYRYKYGYSVNGLTTQSKYEFIVYGGSVLASYTLVDNISDYIKIDIGSIIAYGEYNVSSIEDFSHLASGQYYSNGRFVLQRLLVGGGLRQKFGARSSVTIMVLYDLLRDPHSPYENPVFQVGFSL